MTETTRLDAAHAAMEAAPDDGAARLRFYERLADGDLAVGHRLVARIVPPRDTRMAFAQVVEQLQRVKTVQYTETRSHLPRPGKPAGPTTVTKYWIQGRSQQRQEIVSTTKGDPLPEGRAWSIAPVGMASVSNLVTGKTVSLDTKEKVFSEIKGFLSIDPDTGELNETKPHPMPEVDFYRQIRDFPADEAERLPEQTLDDRKVVGFRTVESNERPGGVDSWTRTYWVDAESNLPVQVEVTFTSTQPTMGHSKWVLSDIVFDEPLDESLFSTEPPEGYTVREE